jgi:hypothetical protein
VSNELRRRAATFSRLTLWPFLFFILIGLSVITSQAQDNVSSAAEASADVHFTIKTKTGSTIFRIGEVIPLELSFSSGAEKVFQINMASYDRSGRMSYETFLVEPESGWHDPLQNYFGSLSGGLGGGLTSFKFLSSQPIVLSLQLNEWVRFDVPGKYRLEVATHRVADIRGQDANAIGARGCISQEGSLTGSDR